MSGFVKLSSSLLYKDIQMWSPYSESTVMLMWQADFYTSLIMVLKEFSGPIDKLYATEVASAFYVQIIEDYLLIYHKS